MTTPPRLRGWRRVRTRHTPVAEHVSLGMQDILYREEISGMVLMASAAVAVVVASSPWGAALARVWEAPLTIDLQLLHIEESVRDWINHFLMTLFFLGVALEIKEEMLVGRLARWKEAALPVAMAIGGMAGPALLFLAVTIGTEAARGWAIPMATDVAFALGVIALLGDRVPDGARLLLLAVAVVDDIGSIIVIAVFYTHDLRLGPLAAALVPLGVLFAFRVLRVRSISIYLLGGLALWLTIFQSGIHPTLAGVVLAFFIPAHRPLTFDEYALRMEEGAALLRRTAGEKEKEAIIGELDELTDETQTPLERLRVHLQPWVSYCVLPLFALANAGVVFSGAGIEALREPVAAGVFAGLLLGKPLGMLAAAWLAVRAGLATFPATLRRRDIAGLGLLGGIGFTVSLFIAGLSFEEQLLEAARSAVLLSSVAMAVAGFVWFRIGSAAR